MTTLKLYQVDAFASEVFAGNPAAVVPLETWLPDATLQNIALENNLSETAFFIPTEAGYHLRWFTPTHGVQLCGHATLASAFVIFEHLKSESDQVHFDSLSGPLSVTKRADGSLVLDFPRIDPQPCAAPQALLDGLGKPPTLVLKTEGDTNYYAVYAFEADVAQLQPKLAQFELLEPYGVVVTAPSDTVDFVSRYFVPWAGIPEDPVTGSIHCALVPYWAAQLGKQTFVAQQLSKRGGRLLCELQGERVWIGGHAVQYLEGTIVV